MTYVTCRLTAKNLDRLQNRTLGNRVWATIDMCGDSTHLMLCIAIWPNGMMAIAVENWCSIPSSRVSWINSFGSRSSRRHAKLPTRHTESQLTDWSSRRLWSQVAKFLTVEVCVIYLVSWPSVSLRCLFMSATWHVSEMSVKHFLCCIVPVAFCLVLCGVKAFGL